MGPYDLPESSLAFSEEEPKNKKGKLFGFRSNKTLHKFIAVIYMLILIIVTFSILFGMPENASGFDIIISDARSLLSVALFASPFIFLSDTKYRDKIPFFKKRNSTSSLVGFVCVFILFMVVWSILGNFFSDDYKNYLKQKNAESSTGAQEQQFETQEDYKQACQTFVYEDLLRHPEQYKGNLATFTGKVEQVRNYSDKVWFRLGTNEDDFGIWSDMVFVEFNYADTSKARILEDDMLTVYGELNGIKTYTAIFGNEVQIPYLKAKYIKMK